MMKIIFFIGRRQIDNFSFGNIVNRDQFKFIAIITENDLSSLEKRIRSNFDCIHTIPSKETGILAEIDVDEAIKYIETDIKKINPSELSVVCQDEANVLVAGALRSKFHTKTGAKLEELYVFRDKVLMKQCLENNKIRIPKYVQLNTNYEYSEIVSLIGTPFIIKPISSAGSFGVKKINSKSEYLQFKEDTKDLFEYEAEEFINGTLFHCDTVIKNKQFKFLECSTYTCPNLDFQRGYALGSLPIFHDDPLFNKIALFTKQALIALGAPDGTHHMELFINQNNEIIFLEVGARAPGFVISQIYEKTFGINLLDLDLQVQADVVFLHERKVNIPSFWSIFPIKNGTVKQLVEPDIVSKYDIKWLVEVGEETGPCLSNVNLGALIIVSNKDYKTLALDFQKVAKHIAIIYE